MSVAKVRFVEASPVILTSLGYWQLAALPMQSAVYTTIGFVSVMAITLLSVLLVQPIIQCGPGDQPSLPHTAVWDGSAPPQQPHQGWDIDPQVSRGLFEVEYGLIGACLQVFHSFLLCLTVLSHIILFNGYPSGQELLINLCNLYLELREKSLEEYTHIFIQWSLENIHMYYLYGSDADTRHLAVMMQIRSGM